MPNQWATPACAPARKCEEAGELSPPGLVKVSAVESVQEVGGARKVRGWRSKPLKLQSVTRSMRHDEYDAENDSGHHFELSAIEVIDEGPPCPSRRAHSREPDVSSRRCEVSPSIDALRNEHQLLLAALERSGAWRGRARDEE